MSCRNLIGHVEPAYCSGWLFLVISFPERGKGLYQHVSLLVSAACTPWEGDFGCESFHQKKMRCSKVQMKNELEDINVYRKLYSLFFN